LPYHWAASPGSAGNLPSALIGGADDGLRLGKAHQGRLQIMLEGTSLILPAAHAIGGENALTIFRLGRDAGARQRQAVLNRAFLRPGGGGRGLA